MTGAAWHTILAAADFPTDGKYVARLGGWQVLIAQTDDGYHAFSDRCPHAASALSGGRVRRGAIMCPLHGARFDLATGKCLGGPYSALRRFPLRVVHGRIEVEVPATAPGMDEMPVRIA